MDGGISTDDAGEGVAVTMASLPTTSQARKTSPSIEKLVALLTNKFTKELYDRHNVAIKKIASSFKESGLRIVDLENICFVIDFLKENVSKQPILEDSFEALARVFVRPFVSSAAFDDVWLGQHQIAAIRSLATCVQVDSLRLKTVVAEVFMQILDALPENHAKDAEVTPEELITRKRSMLPALLGAYESIEQIFIGELMKASSSRDDGAQRELKQFHFFLVRIMSSLSRHGANPGDEFLALCFRFLQGDFRDEIVFWAMDIIWHTIQGPRGDAALMSVCTWKNVSILHDAVRNMLLGGYRIRDKELRNELLVILGMMARIPESLPHLVDTGCLALIIDYASDFRGSDRLIDFEPKPFCLTSSKEEFEMIFLMWNCVFDVSCVIREEGEGMEDRADVVKAKRMIGMHFIPMLVDCFREGRKGFPPRWNDSQREQLTTMSLHFLGEMMNQFSEYLHEIGFENLVEEFILDEQCPYTPVEMSALIRSLSNDRLLRKPLSSQPVLERLVKIATSSTFSVATDAAMVTVNIPTGTMTGTGATGTQKMTIEGHPLSSLLGGTSNGSRGTAGRIPRHIRADYILALSNIVSSSDSATHDLIELGLFSSLLSDLKNLESMELSFASIDLLWAMTTSAGGQFAANIVLLEGVYILLEVLESDNIPYWIQSHILSLLVDLLRLDEEAREEFLEWKSKKSRFNAIQLLIALWDSDAEEQALYSKIHCVFRILGFDSPDYTRLDSHEKGVLMVIQKYVDLERARLTEEIQHELAIEGIEPVEEDAEALAKERDEVEMEIAALAEAQKKLEIERRESEEEEERLFYAELLRKEEVAMTGVVQKKTMSITEAKLRQHAARKENRAMLEGEIARRLKAFEERDRDYVETVLEDEAVEELTNVLRSTKR
eukprot:TRINITY_DN2227_c0_g1_i1.p1 TRINITY_DN2227_c0_g1~~TRINITY_DN2227_c0_g1_i1.p1  ORF type:complete len:894 (-),score=268.90 TRINITY_DN2227_c0_g1_i1:2138-4819(-)